MKGFAFVLLCALVAVQARHTAVQKSGPVAAALGENPWLVHLRIAVSTSGLLNTCSGSLIDSRWVLTAASCVDDARFIWIRYGTVNVINPELVTENSIVRLNNGAALISINRYVEPTENIAPITLSTDEVLPSIGKLCLFGEDNGVPGETLSCQEGSLDGGDDITVSEFDIGAAVVVDGVQVGILTATDDGKIGSIEPVATYLEWIEEETGIAFNSNVVPEISPEAVKIVN